MDEIEPNLEMKYDSRGHIESVGGYRIAWDKHAYVCPQCYAVFQSKNINSRSLFDTDDPKCNTCPNTCNKELIRICKCEPIV